MWKILAGFALFGALAVFVLLKSGDKVTIGGEEHLIPASAHEVASAPAASAAAAAPAAASASAEASASASASAAAAAPAASK